MEHAVQVLRPRTLPDRFRQGCYFGLILPLIDRSHSPDSKTLRIMSIGVVVVEICKYDGSDVGLLIGWTPLEILDINVSVSVSSRHDTQHEEDVMMIP